MSMRLPVLLAALAVASGPTFGGSEQARVPFFVEPGPESGLTSITVAAKTPWIYVIDNIGTGVALLDYDMDGDLDIFQVQASALDGFPGQEPPTDHLYRNDGKGRFTDVTKEAGLGASAWGQGAIVADFDNDGDPDLYVTSYGLNRLYRNEGNGTFKEIAAEAGVGNTGWSTSAAFFDYDGDGLLDLYVARYIIFDPAKIPKRGDPDHPCTFRGVAVVCGPMSLPGQPDILYHNNGDGTFTDVTLETGVGNVKPSFGLGVVTGDVDNDGDPDILVANDSEPNFLFINDGRGHFTEQALMAGVAYSGDGRGQANMGVTLGDPDGDGDLDVFITHFSHDYATLFTNDGKGNFEDTSLRAGLVEPTIISLNWGTDFSDFDNDGDEDLFISNGHVYPEADDAHIGSSFLQHCQIFLNDGKARYTEATSGAGPAMAYKAAHRGAAFGDVDDDGDIDVIVTRMYERLAFYRNDLPRGNHWIGLRLVGRRSNRDAIGARVWVTAGGKKHLKERVGGGSFESSNDPRLHIGLGTESSIESIEIRWPSGLVQKLAGGGVDRILTLVEPAPGQPSQ
jgi:enediyne biosynthesis protein E4